MKCIVNCDQPNTKKLLRNKFTVANKTPKNLVLTFESCKKYSKTIFIRDFPDKFLRRAVCGVLGLNDCTHEQWINRAFLQHSTIQHRIVQPKYLGCGH